MPLPSENDRCTFVYVDGRRCRMFKVEGHPYLCFYHWNRAQQANDSILYASQLLEPGQKLDSPAAVVDALTGVFRLLAAGRLERQQATGLAYVAQTISHFLLQMEQPRPAADQTTDVFDTIQKGSLEEDIVRRMLNRIRGVSQDPASAAGKTIGPSPLPSPTDSETEAGAAETAAPAAESPAPAELRAIAGAPNNASAAEFADGDTVPETAARTTTAQATGAEDLLQKRRERAREFGPPVLIRSASERAELDGHSKKRKDNG